MALSSEQRRELDNYAQILFGKNFQQLTDLQVHEVYDLRDDQEAAADEYARQEADADMIDDFNMIGWV